MVEMLEDKLFPGIAKANQQKEKREKQTGHSRYGDQMKEHFFLSKFGQITLKTKKNLGETEHDLYFLTQ